VLAASIIRAIRPGAGSCEHGNEPFASIKGEEFSEYVSLLLASEEFYSMELVKLCTEKIKTLLISV
jgi:hypothetical protein